VKGTSAHCPSTLDGVRLLIQREKGEPIILLSQRRKKKLFPNKILILMEFQSSNSGNHYAKTETGDLHTKYGTTHQQQHTPTPSRHGSAMMEDQRQDFSVPENRWNNFSSTVQNIGEFIFEMKDSYCHGPCFVASTGSSNSHDSDRMEAPVVSSSLNESPSPYLNTLHISKNSHMRFPSVHLDMDDWDSRNGNDEDIDDSAYFFQTRNGGNTPLTSSHTPALNDVFRQQQPIYRPKPGAFGSGFVQQNSATFATTASQYPPIPSSSAGAGLYRSPAIGDSDSESNTDDNAGIDILEDVNFLNASGNYDNLDHYKNTNSNQVQTPIIDMANVEDLFESELSFSNHPR